MEGRRQKRREGKGQSVRNHEGLYLMAASLGDGLQTSPEPAVDRNVTTCSEFNVCKLKRRLATAAAGPTAVLTHLQPDVVFDVVLLEGWDESQEPSYQVIHGGVCVCRHVSLCVCVCV